MKDADAKGDGYLPLAHTSTPTRRAKHRLARFVVWATSTAIILWLANLHEPFKRVTKSMHERNHPLYGKAAEKEFLGIPNEESAIAASRLFATKPHMAGTPGDFDTAVDFLRLLERELLLPVSGDDDLPVFSAGSPESRHATLSASHTRQPRAWIDKYYPVMNTPLDRVLEIVDENGESVWKANVEEYSDETDPDAFKYSTAVPAFHGLSAQGDVTGHVVDGNYCSQDDFNALVADDVDLKGTIVLCRYGGIFRGLKVKGAQELGAVGVLIYSDPRDDGAITEANGYKLYPHGPARAAGSVQRGSVQYLSVYPGDPTTPGYPSYENATRIEPENVPLIPSLPISWENAKQLFRLLDENDPLSGKKVHLVNNVNTDVIPIWNTMGVIPGFIRDEVVVVGNHRDAWVMGAADPSSGTASIHEVVRGFGQLLRLGWKPLRTIVIASWDAEEYGLIGSTEWGEDFADWIDKHVVAYVNLDSSVSGSRFGMSGSPLLSHFLRTAAEEVDYPSLANLWAATGSLGSLYEDATARNATVNAEATSIRAMETAALDSVGVSPLGSGSDYTVFLQRNGIPSSNGGFGRTDYDPAYHYHSIFDSERWQEQFADPGFYRHVAAAKWIGLQTLRLASLPVLPFNTTHYAQELEIYLNNAESLAAQFMDLNFKPLRKSIHELQKASQDLDKARAKAERDLIKLVKKWKDHEGKMNSFRRYPYKLWCKIKPMLGYHSECGCPSNEPVTGEDLEELEELKNVLEGLAFHTGLDSMKIARSLSKPGRKHPMRRLRKLVKRIRKLNKKARAFEKGFISKEGIKDREWYKHLGVAPGKWLGYGATTLPGLSEAITFDKSPKLASYEVKRLHKLIDKLVKEIEI